MSKARRTVGILAALGVVTGCGADAIPSPALMSEPPSLLSVRHEEWSAAVPVTAINSAFNEIQPSISKNGLSLYFVSRRTGTIGSNDIWVAHRDCRDCEWQTPMNLGPTVNSTSAEASPRQSRDGHRLFFASNRPGGLGGQDIYVSYREDVHDDFAWQTPVNLGAPVNSSVSEASPFLLESDELGSPQLYFDRQIGTGSAPNGDIYMNELGADGTWTTPEPVSELNSAAADNFPSLSHNGLEIYFWSIRGPSFAHIYVARRASVLDPWSAPAEIGPPVSTSEGEIMPFFYSHGNSDLLFHVRDDAHNGNFDIYVSTRR